MVKLVPLLVMVNVCVSVALVMPTSPKSVPSLTLGVESPSAMSAPLPETAISGRKPKGETV